jgi:hypothetical protein
VQQQNSIVIRAGIGDVFAMIAAEGNGYSPDLVHDMVQRTRELFNGTLKDAMELGYVTKDDDEDGDLLIDEEDDEESDEEVGDVGKKFWRL